MEGKKKRVRRTKAQIEADKAAAEAVNVVEVVEAPQPEHIPGLIRESFDAGLADTAYLNKAGEWFFHESQAIKAWGAGNYKTIKKPE